LNRRDFVRVACAGAVGAATFELATPASASFQRGPVLQDVLAAAATYIADYETTPWAMLAEERYQQTETRSGSRQVQRFLESEVLLAGGGASGWVWLRDVLDVDGVSLKRELGRLQKILVDAPPDAQARLRRIMLEGMAHHLGNALRTVDPPTLDLIPLRRDMQHRMGFVLDGSKSLNGRPHAIVHGVAREVPGLPYFSGAVVQSRFWIDTATGCVAQSEVQLEARFRQAKITVRYAHQPGR